MVNKVLRRSPEMEKANIANAQIFMPHNLKDAVCAGQEVDGCPPSTLGPRSCYSNPKKVQKPMI